MTKGKKIFLAAIIIAIIACVVFVIIPASNKEGNKKYYLKEETRVMAVGHGLYDVTKETYIELTDVSKENGRIKRAHILVHLVYKDGSWKEYDSPIMLMSSSSSSQRFQCALPWDEVDIDDSKIKLMYNVGGLLYPDLTFYIA